MKIKTSVPNIEYVELLGYDYKLLNKELGKRSDLYRGKNSESEKLRRKQLSPLISIDILGDSFVGKPTLTIVALLLWYRNLVHVGIRNFLRKKIGNVTGTFIYQVGQEAGKELLKKGLINRKKLHDQIKEVCDALKVLKMGILEIPVLRKDYVHIIVYEYISCAGSADIEVACFWSSGLISGIFKSLIQKDVETVEYKCWGNEDQTCEFDVFIGKAAVEKFVSRWEEIKTMLNSGRTSIKVWVIIKGVKNG